MFDVIVIGGNLAGTSAAINASSRGLNVALVEKNEQPFSPAHCGEAIHKDILEYFDLLHNHDYIKNPIMEVIINVGIKKYNYKFKTPLQMIIDRNYIENELLQRAEKQGVKLILGNRMKDFNRPNDIILADNTVIQGKIIIDSSGIACQVGRLIGLANKLRPEDIGVGIQSRIQGNFNVDTMKLWFHKPYGPMGYAWLFPLNDKLANVGIGIMGGQKFDMKELLDSYIKYEIKGDYKILSTYRSCVPITAPLNRVYKENVMITGDAARLANSLTAGGMRYALISGSLAGIIASKYIKKEINSLELYQLNLNKTIRSLTKIYNIKRKMEKEKNFIKIYSIIFSIACNLNNIAPNICQNYLFKSLRKDWRIIDSLKAN